MDSQNFENKSGNRRTYPEITVLRCKHNLISCYCTEDNFKKIYEILIRIQNEKTEAARRGQ